MAPRNQIIDKFAAERALFHAIKGSQADNQGAAFDVATLIEQILQERGFTQMPAPQKGKDYFTEDEIQQIKDEVFSRIKLPEVKVDYESLKAYILQEVVNRFIDIPQPQDGKQGPPGPAGAPGKDAVLNLEELATKVAALIPKAKKEKVLTLKEVKDLIDAEIRAIPPQPVHIGGSVASLRALTDVDLSRMPMDSRGNYIFNRYNLTVSATPPASPQVNDLWVDIS